MPGIYRDGIDNKYFDHTIFWLWVLQGVAEGILVFAIPVYFLPYTNYVEGVEANYSWYEMGAYSWNALVFIASIKILMELKRWDKWTTFIIILSVSSWFGTACLIDTVDFPVWQYYQTGLFPQIISDPNFWLISILTVIVGLMPHFVFKAVKRQLYPEVKKILQVF